MAFVDFIPPTHEQRTTSFAARFSAFHPPDMVAHPLPPAVQPPTPLNPGGGPPPPLYSSYQASFCPRCQFSTNYSMNGLCINCNLPIPPPPSLIPIQHSAPIQPPGPVRQPPPRSHAYKDATGVPFPHPGSTQSFPPSQPYIGRNPALQSAVTGRGSAQQPSMALTAPQHSLAFSGRGSQDRHDSVDRFMMTSMIDVVKDVLKEPPDMMSLAAVSGVSGKTKVLTIPMMSDVSMHSFLLPGSISSLPPPPLSGEDGCGLGFLPPAKCLPPPLCPRGDTMFQSQQEYFPGMGSAAAATGHKTLLSSSSQDHSNVGSPLGGPLPSSRRTTPPSSTSNPSQAAEPLPTFEEDELESCGKHPDEKLAYLCPACAVLACKSCAGMEHAHHNCLGLREAFVHFRPNMEDLLGKSQVDLDLLEYSLTETKKMNAKVSEKQKEAVGDVQKIFQAHKEAVARREQEVISQINEISSMRITSLTKDEEGISKALESVRALSQAGESSLQEGNRSRILVAHYKLNSKLQSCRPFTSSRSPSEDDSFVLKTHSLSIQSALKTLCLFTTAPYPPLCTVMGEGLYFPRVNKLCTVILATKDRAGEPCLEGGERLFVQLKSASAVGTTVPIDFRDNSDGTYSINFRPQTKGEHQLVIAIRGQHVRGSPFTLFVESGREYGRFGILTQVFGSEGPQNGQFCRPWGICCDQHGNIIVGDRSNHRIQVFDIGGVFKHKFGGEGVRPGQFNRPAGVAMSREGHVVVADKDNHRIQVLKIDGTFLFMFGSKGGNDGQMIYPYDVAVNQFDGRIAVTDTGNHRLLIFSHDGILLGKFGYKGYLCGHFDSPRGIAFNDEGHIIVSDFNVHHILVIHPDGTTARILGCQGNGNGQFMRPQGIAVDHMGNFIVADTRNNRIVIMHRSGHFVAKFGASGSAPGQFDRPTSVAVLPDGRVAVVDFGNSRIQIF